MNRRFLLTLATAAWLAGLYLLYARFVSPLVEPALLAAEMPTPVAVASEHAHVRTQSAHHEIARTHLPNLEWAKAADNQYRIGKDMFLFAMYVEQLDDRAEIKFKPFAMVWKNPNGKPDDPPLRVIADSAVLKFQAPTDQDSRRAGGQSMLGSFEAGGRPVAASLEGQVEIDGPNGLKLTGRDFTFREDSLKLWSDSEILFQYAAHRATGHGMQVDFLPATDKTAVPDMPRLAGIRSVSLLKQVVLDLSAERPADKAAGARNSTGKAGRQLTSKKAAETIHVTSDGRMQYDLESNLVTIEQNVRVVHPLLHAAREGLNCDLLTLLLSTEATRQQLDPTSSNSQIELTANIDAANGNGSGKSSKGASSSPKAGAIENWLPEHLELEKLLADGSGKRRVEIYSPQREMHGNTAQIEYDLTKRTVFLRDPGTVDIMQGPNEIHAPELMLRFAENNKDVTLAVARGTGNVISRLKDGRVFVANWKKQLIKSSDPRTGLDLIELQGQAAIALDTEYELVGDALRLWVTPFASAPKPSGQKEERAPIPQIQRVAGVGQVSMTSPQAITHNEWLDVRFQSAVLPPPEPGEAGSMFGLTPEEKPEPASRRGHQRRNPPPPRQPLDLKSERLVVTVLRDQTDPARLVLATLKAEKSVDITQSMSSDSTQPPVNMKGELLTVQNISTTQQLVELHGTPTTPDGRTVPARIRSGATRIEGPLIALNRQQNTVHVIGPGLLEYPVKTTLEGQPLDRPQVLHVNWAESLKFDGKTADFLEKVEASMDQSTMRCNAMHVTLVKPIRFDGADLKSTRQETIQLARVFCENRVELVTCERRGNEVISRGKGRLGQFVIDNVSGKTEALGPGYFMRWTLGQERREPRSGTNRNAKKAPVRATPAGWTYSRIDFQGHMKGNIQERTATFEDHVEMIYGPVPQATDTVDADKLPEGGAYLTCDSLKVSQFAENASEQPHLRFSAEKNTKLEIVYEGKPLDARADEVKYDESKDLYLLRSNGDRKVLIRKQPTSDGLGADIDCSRVEICPSQNRLIAPKLTYAEFQQ